MKRVSGVSGIVHNIFIIFLLILYVNIRAKPVHLEFFGIFNVTHIKLYTISS